MTREHLFRGFRPDENGTTIITLNGKQIRGEWIEGNYEWYHKPQKHLISNPYTGETKGVLPETVGEFTGLTDKNGKKSFEGDIVEFTDKFTHKKGRAEIVFEAFKWKYSGCYYGGNPIVWLCINDTSVEYEVIGNIHDNPELLEDVE